MIAAPTAEGSRPQGEFVALCGGVGGAKLALGLQHVLGDKLTVVVNVGDDFDHLGLRICPDIDTVLYTLSGLSDQSRGWGRVDETWQFMEALERLGGETWFRLGDRDLALHVERTRRLRAGESLTTLTGGIARQLGILAKICPATDDVLRTMVQTSAGLLEFQRYFVERRCEPQVERIYFEGALAAQPTSAVEAALNSATLSGIIICPSNPYLSIDPIVSIEPLRKMLKSRRVPSVAISPVIGGKAVKGPTGKIMGELGIGVAPSSIALHYSSLIDGLIIDDVDATVTEEIDAKLFATNTLMVDLDTRIRLARDVLAFIAELSLSKT
jgi:LPPG:FO 2-phospho-L-lactate transferase